MRLGVVSVKTDDFDYELPEELIAQTPLEKRDNSKLMILDKNTGEIKHEKFYNIINYLNENDILVLNDTKVMPARIIGEKEDTKAVIELLLLKNLENDKWECLS
jgi:S-adenosylmethionine:tRNA ribosyltransferase-isomerase